MWQSLVSLFCVLFHVSRTAGEADAEAEADAFYGLHGYGGFGGPQGYPGVGIYGGSGLIGWAGYGGNPYPYLAGYAPQPQAPYNPGYATHAPVISHALSHAPSPAPFRAPDHGALHISALAAHQGAPHSVAAVPDLSPLASAPAPSLALAPQHAPAYDIAPAHHVSTAPHISHAPAPAYDIAPAHHVATAPHISHAPASASHVNHAHPVAPAPHVTTSQYHAQDEEGNYSFGYNNPNSAREERGNAHTGVRGSYSDGYHTYHYVADAAGFRHV